VSYRQTDDHESELKSLLDGLAMHLVWQICETDVARQIGAHELYRHKYTKHNVTLYKSTIHTEALKSLQTSDGGVA